MGRLRPPSLDAPLVRRRSSLFTAIVSVSEDSRPFALFSPLLPRFSSLSLLSSPALSIRCRLAGESDILVVKLF